MNVGYQGFLYEVVAEANGVPVSDLAHLEEAIDSNTDPFHVLLTEASNKIVLDRLKVDQTKERIIRNYRIPN